MILKYKEDYKSIKKFDDVEIDDLALVTGLNGVGKTHLLQSIKNGSIEVENIDKDDIVYFNYSSFVLPNEKPILFNELRLAKNMAWNTFDSLTNTSYNRNYFLALKKQYFDKKSIEQIKKITKEKNKSIFYLNPTDFIDLSLNKTVEQFTYTLNQTYKDNSTNKHSKNIINLYKKYVGFIDDILESEFYELYEDDDSMNLITKNISKEFVNFNEIIMRKMASNYTPNSSKTFDELLKACTSETLKQYGGKYPWDLINDLLNSFNDFKYKIIKPDSPNFKSIYHDYNYSAVLKDKNTDLIISFEELSSGEKILLALSILLFQSSRKNIFPKLLLLDEIDSSLHPSMVKNLLDTLQKVFLGNKTKIIFVTHSPSTVSLANENIVYIMKKDQPQILEKIDNGKALIFLTNGFMTLEDGRVILDTITKNKFTVFSEGNNIVYLETAVELFDKEILDKINFFKCIQHRSGNRQLKTLYSLLQNLPFVDKILIVFDADTDKIPDSTAIIHTMKLPDSSNKYTSKGIESLFPDSVFSKDLLDEVYDDDIKRKKYVFRDTHKRKFCSDINQEKNIEYFEKFKPVVEEIHKILISNK